VQQSTPSHDAYHLVLSSEIDVHYLWSVDRFRIVAGLIAMIIVSVIIVIGFLVGWLSIG
jgi:hypothetical protein